MGFHSDLQELLTAYRRTLDQIDGILQPIDLAGWEMAMSSMSESVPVLHFYRAQHDAALTPSALAEMLCGEFEQVINDENFISLKGNLRLLPNGHVFINTPA